ncbi:MAG: RNase J family beta-CASP ribonuclease [Ruminococcaceae bacterium]|nr:RNase J family beta-CASP ribonuclease [Oscillospiraceae bacterium]
MQKEIITDNEYKKTPGKKTAKYQAPKQSKTTSKKSGAAKTAKPKSAAKAPAKQSAKAAAESKPAKKSSAKKNAASAAPAVQTAAGLTAEKPARKGGRKKKAATPIRVTFLGGLNEIGKNMTMYECGDDAIIVDCGMAFPDDTMLGIDMVIPDITYLARNIHKVRAILLTHGHEDHIGAIPYVLKEYRIPVYGTQLTLGLLEGKLREHNILSSCSLNVVEPGSTVDFGCIKAEFINVNHSIPGAVSIALHTPAGIIVQTGDFKIDMTPISGDIIDLGRFAELGKKGVLCLLADSTNAERPGYTASERTVGASFNTLFQSASATGKRIIIATFASNVHRVQQIIDCAERFGRKVAVSGRSMINTVAIGQEMGYLNVPEGLLVDISMINRYPKEQMVLITTGSQGEPMSALSRMAMNDHRQVEVGQDDFIIISANPIPGNEKTVGNVVNELLRHGCEVVYEKMYEVHVSGHACQEELKIILGLTKPQYFIPVHGEQKHLQKHAGLASLMGLPDSNIMVADLGDSVEISTDGIKVAERVPAGRVLVDGLGVGDVGSVVLRDRKHLGQDGLIIAVATIDSNDGHLLSGPHVVSRGFVYVRDAEPLMEEACALVTDVIEECADSGVRDWAAIKGKVRDELSRMMYQRTKRSPMILPVIMEV